MKLPKTLICFLLTFAMLLSFSAVGYAYDSAYNNNINNLQSVTKVEDQGSRDACLTYALASTAGSFYCKVYNNGNSVDKVVFRGASLKNKVGDSTNFGTVLYDSVRYNLGNNCYITGIENLTGRGDRYLKQKIKENGAVFAAIPLPENGFDCNLYNKETASLNCYSKDANGKKQITVFKNNHAVSIVGWDDDFSYENYNGFRTNGAWICKNSYGENFGKNGYFYLSYNYTQHFLYAATVEVTQYPEILSAESADSFWFGLFKAGAVGFRSAKTIENAEIKITGKNKAEKTVKADIVNGYNFVPFEKPLGYSGIKVTVNGQDINPKNLIRYIVKPGKKPSDPAKPVKETEWLEPVDDLSITLSKNNYTATTKKTTHKVTLRSVDNVFVITPCDGYQFTESTSVYLEMAKAGSEDMLIYDGSISELTKNSNIDFTFSGGKVFIKSKNIGGAFAQGVRIELDENSKIKDVYLVEDNGSEQKLDRNSYSVSPEIIPDKGFYHTEIKINGYYAKDDFKVTLTRGDDANETYPADISSEGDNITVGVMVEIPEVELSTFFVVLFMIIGMIFGSFGR